MPSFFGDRQSFYQFAPQMQRQDLLPIFIPELGTDPSQTFQGPPMGGMTSSGNAPKVTTPPSMPQAKQFLKGQLVPAPIIKVGGAISETILPFNPPLTGVNPQTFANTPWLTGVTPFPDVTAFTNTVTAASRAADAQLDPNLAATQAAYQGGVQQSADSAGADQSAAFQGNLGEITHTLINVANESAATPAQSGQANRTQSQAIWIVQQMFKQFFMPVSILLLLVGAVGSQTSNYVRYTFVESSEGAFEIAQAFDGIIRAIGALFLICSIQLVVSYFIDFGNAITEPIEQLIDQQTIVQWTQGFSNPTQNMTPAQATQYQQNESTAAATGRVAFNTVQALLNSGLMVLTQYQLVMVCYLFLFGPIAAALWAWPAVGTAKLRLVLGAWLNGMSNLVMWRFWWCVILLCMSTRIHWLQDIGSYDPNSPWEPIVYTAFMAILAYVPFAALDFRPGEMVDRLLDKGTKAAG